MWMGGTDARSEGLMMPNWWDRSGGLESDSDVSGGPEKGGQVSQGCFSFRLGGEEGTAHSKTDPVRSNMLKPEGPSQGLRFHNCRLNTQPLLASEAT